MNKNDIIAFGRRIVAHDIAWTIGCFVGGMLVLFIILPNLAVRIPALAIASVGLFYFAVKVSNRRMRFSSYGFGFLALFYFANHYFWDRLLHPYWSIRLNFFFLIFIGLCCAYFGIIYFFGDSIPAKEKRRTNTSLEVAISFFVFLFIRSNIILLFDSLQGHGTSFIKRLIGYSMQHDVLVRSNTTQFLLLIFYILYTVGLWRVSELLGNRFLRYGSYLVGVCVVYMLSIIVYIFF